MSSYLSYFIFCSVGTIAVLLILRQMLPAQFLAAGHNARSNHTTAARQLGGLALIPAALAAILVAVLWGQLSARFGISLTISASILCYTGYLDDAKELSIRARLPAQFLAALIGLYGLGEESRLLPDLLPYWLEFLLLTAAVFGSINVTNFMDGLDWLTVSGIGIPLLLLGIIAVTILQQSDVTANIAVVSFAISGAVAGFALFNRPPARIFLGDSGSLPLGLITALLFILFAAESGMIAALILPLYYILDAGSTIILRLRKGENILQAHSQHAYQIARRAGQSVYAITGKIAALNLCLGLICATVISWPVAGIEFAGLLLAIVLASLLIRHFRFKG